MARRSRRADEVTPKLHYRPGVDDPDLEATIVGFYGTRQGAPPRSPILPQCIDNQEVSNKTETASVGSKDTIADKSTDTVAPGSTDIVSDALRDTVGVGSPDTNTAETRDTVAGASKDTVADVARATVTVGLREAGAATSKDTVFVRSADTISVESKDTVAAGSEEAAAVDSGNTVTVSADTGDTLAVGLQGPKQGAGDCTEERGRRTYEGIAKKRPADTVSVKPTDMVVVRTETTVPATSADTVAADLPETVAVDQPPGPTRGLWYTEGKKEGIFPASRVRKIVLAQDALTHAEESVYDVLWGPKNQNRDDQRLTSIGYDGIAKAARVTKMNAKWIVERLVHKGFVKVETLPDPLRRIPTSYRVFGYRAALEDMRHRNRFYIVRTGNGVLFAHPFNPENTVSTDLADTVAFEQPTTVPGGQAATISLGQAETVPCGPQATVSVADTLLGTTPEATLIQVISTVTDQIIGNDAALTIVSRCRAQAPDFTNEELADITKTEALKAIRERRSNLIGWLITVLPGRFGGESFRIYRETQQTLRKQERQEQEAQAQRWRQILNDPTEDEEFKKLAREALGIGRGREETR